MRSRAARAGPTRATASPPAVYCTRRAPCAAPAATERAATSAVATPRRCFPGRRAPLRPGSPPPPSTCPRIYAPSRSSSASPPATLARQQRELASAAAAGARRAPRPALPPRPKHPHPYSPQRVCRLNKSPVPLQEDAGRPKHQHKAVHSR